MLPKRYILCFLGFVMLFVGYVQRTNLSIAIVAMVKPVNNSTLDDQTSPRATTYAWDIKTQGYILSAVFYGMVLVQIPAGFLATKYGGKILAGAGIGICGFLMMFTPLAAGLGVVPLIILRICHGITGGCLLPAMHSLWSKWAPTQDRSILPTFAFSGMYVGTFVTMFIGGPMAEYWSWEWIFYLSGLLAMFWAVMWLYLVSESPATHPTISKEELILIESNIDIPPSRTRAIPWKEILTSLPVWAIVVAHFGSNWILSLGLTELPTFLANALHYRVAQAGILAAIPWILVALVMGSSGFLSDHLRKKYSTIFVRKLFIFVAFSIIIVSLLILILLVEARRVLIIICIIIALVSCGFSFGSFGTNHIDIGAHYAGFLMGLSNCFASLAGVLVPTVTGYLVHDSHFKEQWNVIFFISLCICLLVLMFFTLFAEGQLQPWVEQSTDEYQSLVMKPSSHLDHVTESVRDEIDLNK